MTVTMPGWCRTDDNEPERGHRRVWQSEAWQASVGVRLRNVEGNPLNRCWFYRYNGSVELRAANLRDLFVMIATARLEGRC